MLNVLISYPKYLSSEFDSDASFVQPGNLSIGFDLKVMSELTFSTHFGMHLIVGIGSGRLFAFCG